MRSDQSYAVLLVFEKLNVVTMRVCLSNYSHVISNNRILFLCKVIALDLKKNGL